RQVLRDAAPAIALVGAGEEGAAAGPEIDACRRQPVGRHRLAQHAEEGILLRQPLAQRLPAGAAVAGPPYRGLALGDVAARRIAVERQEKERRRVARMGRRREAEARGQARLDALPVAAAILAAIHAAMVLLEEPVGH